MSKFSDKIFSGKPATDEDWTNYLHDAHHSMPGMTEFCFADHPTDLGPNTYEVLASKLDTFKHKAPSILDLACGDGYLLPYVRKYVETWNRYVGVDMVESEIQRAAERYRESSVEFVCAKAQKLPFSRNEFDIVLCHMALMLMLPLDPVLAEISRVLKDKGSFLCVIGRKTPKGGLFSVMGEKTVQFIQTELSKAAHFRTGDERIADSKTLHGLFSSYSLKVERATDYSMLISGSPESLWENFKNFYVVSILPEAVQGQLETKLLSDLRAHSVGGQAKLELPLTLIEATKE